MSQIPRETRNLKMACIIKDVYIIFYVPTVVFQLMQIFLTVTAWKNNKYTRTYGTLLQSFAYYT